MLEDLNKEYDKLQNKYGSKKLDSIYNGGCKITPDICYVFMNPTGRNIASYKTWKGLKAPWIGTKNIWKLFYKLDVVSIDTYNKISSIKGPDWTEEFAKEVYEDVTNHKVFITNLGKCTQDDARPLKDEILAKYLKLLFKEFEIIKPKVIILFGNQVSSIVLNEKISVSQVRRKKFEYKGYTFYSVYYPVGNGAFNVDKAIEDINWIKEEELC
jgi:DNA polymerase